MSSILIAWEWGENWGHLSRDLPVARRLRESGCRVAFAVADTRIAAEVLGPEGFAFAQTPLVRRPPAAGKAFVSHAEIALAKGYDDPSALRGLIGGWLGLFEMFRPDALLADYAPTAVLAARIRSIPAVLTGNGFELPPRSCPVPSFRPWESVPPARLAAIEEAVLRNINHVFNGLGAAPLPQFADIFSGQQRVLTTFAELDHYGERPDESYAGPLFDLPNAHSVAWQTDGARKRIFAYLRPSTPRVEDLLIALRASGADVVCAFPGVPPALTQRYKSPRLRIFTEPVALGPLLPEADLVIGSGSGTAAASLLAGVPLLLVPQWAEQRLVALRVEALGAGVVGQSKTAPSSYPALIERVLSQPEFRLSASRFAEKYKAFRVGGAAERVVDAIQRAIAATDLGGN